MKTLLRNKPKTIIFCLGCLSALAMAPVYAWPFMMAGYTALIYVLLQGKNQDWKQAGLYGFLFFFGYFLTSLYWVSSSLFVEIERWWWALPLSFAGLPFVLSLFPSVFIIIASFATKHRFFGFVIALIIADIARGYLFTGFPWNLPAHTWVKTEIVMKSLSTIGLYGLNTLTIFIFTLPIILGSYSRIVLIVAMACMPFIPLSSTQTQSNIPAKISLIQANITQSEKWDDDYIWRNFNRYIDMSYDAVADEHESQIVIWPETAISQNLLGHPRVQEIFIEFLNDLPIDSLLITGFLNHDIENYYNSIAVFNRQGQIIATYDKHHLVPFGEYMPFGLDTITGFSNFSAGEPPQIIAVENHDVSFLPLICYESIFPQYSNYTNESDFTLILTNDSWFGHTAGPYQHFDHAIFRAYEAQKPVIRLSGNGLSGFINENGEIQQISHLNTISTIKSH